MYALDVFLLFFTKHALTGVTQILSLSMILFLLTWWHAAILSGNLGGKPVLNENKIRPILSWQIYEFMPTGNKAMGCVPQRFGHIQAWHFDLP